MHVAVIVISILLAVFLGFLGISKLLGTKSSRAITDHLGVSVPLSQAIGVAECLAVLGFIGAVISIKAAGIAAAIGVCVLMIGAVFYHVRVGDKAKDLAPAVLVGILSAAVLAMQFKY
jgi:hypothetical protein